MVIQICIGPNEWSQSVYYPTEISDLYLSKLVDTYQLVYKRELTPEEKEISKTWPNEALSKAHLKLVKDTLKAKKLTCFNVDHCQKLETKPTSFGQCTRCHFARYCSTNCQAEHWKSKHKRQCNLEVTKEVVDSIYSGRRIIIGSEAEAKTDSYSEYQPKS